MIRAIRVRAGLFSTISLLLALVVTVTLAVPTVLAANAHVTKQAKKHKKHQKSKKKTTKKVTSVKVTGGSETLVFDASAAQALEKANVAVAAVSPATGALGSGFVFPLARGRLNPATGFGSLTATGGLTFSTSVGVPGFSFGGEATLSEPFLGLGSTSTFSFTSQEATPPRFSFVAVALKRVHPLVDGSAITLMNLPASLTSTGAQFLNDFAGGAFKSGETVGSATVQVTASS
jgi:hypothetical protein